MQLSLRLFIPAIQGKYHRQISLRSKASVVKIPHSTIFCAHICVKYSEIIVCIINVWGLSSLYCLYEEAS